MRTLNSTLKYIARHKRISFSAFRGEFREGLVIEYQYASDTLELKGTELIETPDLPDLLAKIVVACEINAERLLDKIQELKNVRRQLP